MPLMLTRGQLAAIRARDAASAEAPVFDDYETAAEDRRALLADYDHLSGIVAYIDEQNPVDALLVAERARIKGVIEALDRAGQLTAERLLAAIDG